MNYIINFLLGQHTHVHTHTHTHTHLRGVVCESPRPYISADIVAGSTFLFQQFSCSKVRQLHSLGSVVQEEISSCMCVCMCAEKGGTKVKVYMED